MYNVTITIYHSHTMSSHKQAGLTLLTYISNIYILYVALGH